MLKVIGGEQEGEFKAVASGTLPNGKPVVVNADGTVSAVALNNVSDAVGSSVTFESANSYFIDTAYDVANSKVVICYIDGGNSSRGTAVVGTVSGTTISFGSPVIFHNDSTTHSRMVYDANAEKVVIVFQDNSSGSFGQGKAVVGTVSGTSISFGSKVAITSGQTMENFAIAYDANAQKVVIAFRDYSNNNYGGCVVGTVSGTSISFGSKTVYNSATTLKQGMTYDSTAQKIVLAYHDYGATAGNAVVGTVSGTSISFGSEATFESNGVDFVNCVYDASADRTVVAYQDSGNSNLITAAVGTVSGTSISFGTPVVFDGAVNSFIGMTYHPTIEKTVIAYQDDGNSGAGTVVTGTVSGTSITFDTPLVFDSNPSGVTYLAAAYDSGQDKVVIAYRPDNTNYGTGIVFRAAGQEANLTAENYVGMSQGYTDRGSQSVGSATTFEAANVLYTSATFDSNSNKVVIAYRDSGNSNYGTAVVGTVSGTSISFGSPAVFNSDGQTDYISTAFDSANNKVVIAYRNLGNSNYGTAIVGTVSGTSISFGSASVFNSGTTTYPSLTFDTNASKIVVAYQDNSNSFYGTAAVGTVSGTSISFGTEVVFNSGITSYTSAVFDSSNNKVVIGYQDASNSNYGTAIVGTVSGTSISFGSEVVFESARVDFVDSTFDSFSEKVIFAYKDEANSNSGTAVVGTVSGTSVSFGTPVVFQASYSDYVQCVYDSSANKTNIFFRDNTSAPYPLQQTVGTVSGTSISFTTSSILENVNASYIGATFDSNVNKVVVTYRDESNSYYGKAIVFQNAYDNSGSVADGDPARTDIIGSVSTNQSGLTAGEKYYVQTDGTLSTTAGSPSVLAGTAISATKLVVKT